MSKTVGALGTKVRRIMNDAPCHMGVSIRIVGRGPVLDINSSECFPMASVYKVPLLATVFHRAALGKMDLGRRIVLREEDKALGSGDLQYLSSGVRLTVHDLCYLMIVHSDNTATDMVHNLLGINGPNEYMRSLGLHSIDIHCPNREYFIALLGWPKRFKGFTMGQLARYWKALSREQRIRIYSEIREEFKNMPASEMQKAALAQWGLSGEKETAEMRVADEAMDNPGTPADIAALLELIATNQIAPANLTEQMLEYMFLCDARERLRKRLPDGVMAANKTGSVAGTVNDCAIIEASKRARIAVACFAKRIKYPDISKVEDAISRIGLEAYKAFKV